MTKVGCAQLESSVFCAVGLGDLLTGLTLSADCHLGPLTRAPQFSSRWPPARFVLFRSWKPIMEERNRKVHCRFLRSPFTVHSKKLHRVAFFSSYQAQLISGQVRLQMGNGSKFGPTWVHYSLPFVQKIFTFPQRCKNILAPSFKSTKLYLDTASSLGLRYTISKVSIACPGVIEALKGWLHMFFCLFVCFLWSKKKVIYSNKQVSWEIVMEWPQ